jgi:hypothetical protein
VQAGVLKAPCAACPTDGGLRLRFGCDGKAPRPVFSLQDGDRIIDYWNCPSKFIPASILDFWKRYQYLKAFPGSAPQFDAQSSRFISAWVLFESELQQMLAAKG